jgi:hypothetical protein
MNWQLVLVLLTAIGALITAIFTANAADATRKAARGSALLSCLDKYVAIRKDRRKAIENRKRDLAEEYYREILDLHWNEYHLWLQGVIPDEIMFSWLQIRKRNFESDKIEVETDARGTITYQSQWQELKTTNYFEQNDPFVGFMDKTHSGQITHLADLKKIKKELMHEKL